MKIDKDRGGKRGGGERRKRRGKKEEDAEVKEEGSCFDRPRNLSLQQKTGFSMC